MITPLQGAREAMARVHEAAPDDQAKILGLEVALAALLLWAEGVDARLAATEATARHVDAITRPLG